MPNVPSSRTSRRQPLKASPSSPDREPIATRSPRVARRKLETRLRLLDAAFELVAQKGMDGVTITEITNAADVGFGSFYNYFDSKEGIFTALVEWLFEEFASTLDRLAAGLPDPAEAVAVSVRHTLLRAYREPVWGQLLIREGLSSRALSGGLGQRLLRDTRRGISERRFIVADELMCVFSVIGTVAAGVAAELHLSGSSKRAVRARKALRSRHEKFAESTAAIVLQAFGIKRAEAEKIARRPLPAHPHAALPHPR
ncbi:AcrR family transcriptional regulator [Paraburkholderia bannensis]|uniref:AcrR family transcriptional regulator n=1 Tax=Paraburkholderia bannensis TaxID=765414 RepID=A0A7W9TYD5_9BURK|nr:MULTISPECIES: TetR/AcrR family transcriptional regulator [Paraburkholderia]MBB3258667.1 AcrR family transcriptional regulator [Paraburkholderia sp. WP4_3_2]MBB6103681.1 AcrR family transcriptional regulator [Paraburkholderia bannensis]